MCSLVVRIPEPVPWRPGLAGAYAGQQSVMESGAQRVPLVFCWCPPTRPDQPFLMKWIELVTRRTGGEASVIVVSTWCRKFPVDTAVTLAGLRAKHGEMIRELVAVDNQDGTGIAELRNTSDERENPGVRAAPRRP